MSAIDTFRRAMRRLEKRARRMGFRYAPILFRAARLGEEPCRFSEIAKQHRWLATRKHEDDLPEGRDDDRRIAYLHERAADAVARLRGAS